jgi:4-carboxymuconolactone decarboxylase
MPDDKTAAAHPQGHGEAACERLPMLAAQQMDAAQQAAAHALVAGPRKAVFGPFIPLLRSPELLDRVGKVGEYLRFGSVLADDVRELAICAVARQVSNQFEWLMHAPLALKAGVAQEALDALRVGARPKGLPEQQQRALDFTQEMLATHGVSDPTYRDAAQAFGERGVVELSTLVGYFAMVCWVMNVARTPALAGAQAAPIAAFPQ